MRDVLRNNKILTAALLLGLVCALVLCGIRFGMESKNTEVTVVMTAEDLAQLSAAPAGVRVFDGGNVLDGALLLVEDVNQYSHTPTDALPSAAQRASLGDELRLVRCFYLYPQFADRYNYLGYGGAEELENILYRAVTDRNIRVLWLTPFVDAQTGEIVTDAAVYEQVLQNLSARIAAHGLTLGDRFSVFPSSYTPNFFLLLGCVLGLVAAGVLLLHSFFPSGRRWPLLVLLTGFVLCGAALLLRSLAIPVFAFGAAVIYPCLALCLAADQLAAAEDRGLGRNLLSFAGALLGPVLVCLIGGLFVGAFQSSTDYLLAIDNFRGVKLSQMLPILFAIYIVFRRIYGRGGIREILSGKKFLLALLLIVLIAGVAVYILRTGNTSVGVMEQRFRNWMEQVLITRPRTKEFLVSWPCLAVAFVLILRGGQRYAWPFAILTAPGLASVVNTFCHSRAPLWLSVTRTALGVVIGLILGLVLVLIFSPRRRKQTL